MTAEGSNVLVRLFSQPSVYLTAREERGKIFIAETQDLTQVVKDIRAQLAPPSAAKGEGRATDAAEVQSPTIPTLPVAAKSEQSAGNEEKTVDPKADPVQPKKPVASRAKGKTTVTEISDADIDALLGDKAKYGGKLISLDLQETDIDNALRIIAEVSNLNIVASEDVKGKVTLRLLDVPWDQALDVILKTNGLDKVVEGSVMRIAPVDKLKVERENLKEAKDAEEDLEPLAVKYMRVSYAKAAEIKSIVETVLSERGSVAYDERSNQLIVKDVRTGLKNVVELVSKIDLRTPQVLLETQIVESSRNLTRELGSQLGFQYIQSPSTGNGTGSNFPSAISFGGSVDPSTGNLGSSFPVAIDPTLGGSAISMLFDSADGTKSLELRLSQLEQEGRIRIISRPAVATTNNKAAEIKSVEKFRVRLPNGGLSVATGAGASASGTSNTATEVIEAGITLNVTPQASPDYYILLDIKARSSTFGSNYRVGDIPNEFERSASSTVLVSSGQTFALGGIYKVTESDTVSGVPFFKDIPVIGTFFRRSSTNDSDEELLFFITPRIVEGSFDNASMKSIS
jgi:type IV pilus assembly protein PilQ